MLDNLSWNLSLSWNVSWPERMDAQTYQDYHAMNWNKRRDHDTGRNDSVLNRKESHELETLIRG
jgi:hypothetical protein